MNPKFAVAAALVALFCGAYAAIDRVRGKPRRLKMNLFGALVAVSVFYWLVQYIRK